MTHHEALLKQKKIIENYLATQPHLIAHSAQRPEAECFKEIGIVTPKDKPVGYLRLFPYDFLVEEKTLTDRIIRINEFIEKTPDELKASRMEEQNTLFCHLLKIGIPTPVALQKIADHFKIPLNQIGYAGIKDADAITAQLINFTKNCVKTEDLIATRLPNIYFTNFYWDKGALNPGSLKGNFFTITIRTKENLDETNFSEKLKKLQTTGFLNYFQSQRFGGMRLLSHRLGKLLLQGKIEESIKAFLFTSTPYDIVLVRNLRYVAKNNYSNFANIKNLFEQLPYTFFNELKVVEYLIKKPGDFVGALTEIKDQTKFWVYAYSSLLFNKMLSTYADKLDTIPDKLSIPLSFKKQDQNLYAKYLNEDNISDMLANLRPFPFIQTKGHLIDTKIYPDILDYKFFDRGVVINFSLGKGAYATTFLTNLFELTQGLPIPQWVNLEEIDPKNLLGQGDIIRLKEIFKNDLYSKQENKAKSDE